MSGAVARLDQLAREDATLAPLAMLQATTFRIAAAPFWAEMVPFMQRDRLDGGEPLLHDSKLTVDGERLTSLLRELVAVAGRAGVPGAEALGRAVARLDPLALFEASVTADEERIETIAAEAGVESPLLGTVAHLATLPLLHAIGREAAPIVKAVQWREGFCPVCAAWPTLAEVRGLERARWLRCGRCASAWNFPNQQCAFCDNRDHHSLGYLAPENERESQQAATCDQCQGYLKGFATLSALAPEEIAWRDLTSVALDMAALEAEYARPGALGFPLSLQLEAAPRRFGWLPWGR